MQGQSYAIPTMHGGVDVIKPYVEMYYDRFSDDSLVVKPN